MSRARGFTLIEVMVALMVIAIALPALMTTLYKQVDGTAYLRDKSIAQYVASNKLAETRLQDRRNNTIFEGKRSGVTTMGQRDWFWWMQSEVTEVADFYRIEIRVAGRETDQDSPLVTLVAFAAARPEEATDAP